ncbi:MAG: alpha/beta hydrolase [Planctomycetota bacterium]|nr:MAG: alpha/beta hydrolase [Planctomycetota bacterium]REJ88000.1 MAG: alpha/beta hydrolase [Planctomycetota bacterium]REK24821.1 MAG: alpha/beta hydrolase [Planctomycetota bacterium]REK49420.1 MAG: alpha/beta hydrolase [Planctomycetota bacterium]
MASDISTEHRIVEVAGRKTQVTIGGDGPPLLYLHSAGGETEWTLPHEKLAESHRVYVPACPGFALSEGLDEIEDMQDLVWHYVDLLDVLELERVPVVGFSLGGWLALELSVLRPERIERMALTAAAGLYLSEAPMGEIFIDDLDELRELVYYDPQDVTVKLSMPTSLEDSRILNWIRAREATARIGWNPYLHNPRLKGHLHRIACPTLLIWGRHDRLIPLAHGEYYAEKIAGARLEVLEECGHMVPFEKADAWAGLVREFVTAS